MVEWIDPNKKYSKTFWREDLRQNGFWFVDIPRTSSSSIRVELEKKFGSAYGKESLLDLSLTSMQVFDDHSPVSRMIQWLGEELWDELFTFSLVRNPWDRILSLYFYILKFEPYCNMDFSFKAYLNRIHDDFQHNPGNPAICKSCCDLLLHKNRIGVDFVGKYENRKQDLAYIGQKIGLPGLGTVHTQIATPVDINYCDYYDDEGIEIISTVFAKDIELFEYKFGN